MRGRWAHPDVGARVLLTVGALLPYWRFLTFAVVFITDDYFASDIFTGELPGRAIAARLIRSGHWPVWTNALCSGIPAAGWPADPISVATFGLLPIAPALDLFVVITLLIAAHGTYNLARRLNIDRPGAVLAGLAFAGSGYFAAQLKHLSIVSTVAWLPVGLLMIERESPVGLGLVFAQQVLCGFPQSAYICALTYGAFAVFRALAARRADPAFPWIRRLAALAAAMVLGAAAGAIVLLPLAKLAPVTDHVQMSGWDWATIPVYWRQNILTFLFPYINGDVSDNSYIGHPPFWEDYGYVGVATFLLALYGAYRDRKRPIVAYLTLITLVAYYFVLGRSTPVFRVAYLVLPGLKTFRFPTRFLIVVELGLALLAAFGLTRLRRDLERGFSPRTALIAVQLICVATALDLFVHQRQQNAIVPAHEWLAPPAAVAAIRADAPDPRTFTPRHRELHRMANQEARGWTDVRPYYRLRDLLEPNTGGGYWGIPSADCYSGLGVTWYVDVWSTVIAERGLVTPLLVPDAKTATLRVDPTATTLLAAYGVTHVLSPYPQADTALPLVAHAGDAYIYRIEGAARARFVPAARYVHDDADALARLTAPGFDPTREIVVVDSPGAPARVPGGTPSGLAPASARIVREDSRTLVVDVSAPVDGYLLLADTYYPGWTAFVDGVPAPVLRANVSVRAVAIAGGRHEIRFFYEPPGFLAGLGISIAAVSVLLAWVGVSWRRRHLKA